LRPSASLLALTVLGAPCVTMLAGYLPTLFAITQDPARILTEE
jgi:ABC-type lipoprotein release transport system permease subunit